MALSPKKVRSLPGIKRDGTQFEGDNYIDGLWMRFQRGLPRKIGGFQEVETSCTQKTYGMKVDLVNSNLYVHRGSASFLIQDKLDSSGNFVAQNDRTPAAFGANANNLWQMDAFYDSVAGTQQLVAHAGQNLSSIANTTEYPIYAGDLTAATVLTATGMDPVSGGVVAVGPYLMGYGTNGRVDWSSPGTFVATLDSAFVAGSKIVKGLPLRGTGAGPGAILWSMDSLIRAQFLDPVTTAFGFDTLSSGISVLSSQGIIEYDGIYYWPGVDRFLMFNGVTREIPNTMNVNWFFDNLNFAQRQKVFAFKVTRYGEIWWCFPFGSATECTHAVIYNVRENTWYDTQLPSTRSAGASATSFQKPYMCEATPDDVAGKYTLWQHETGVDRVRTGLAGTALRSYFRTAEMSVIADGGKDVALRIGRTEPDFVQAGPLTVKVIGRANARAADQDGETFTFPQTPTADQEQIVNMKEGRRLLSLQFESNIVGGDYQMGDTLAFLDTSGGRFTG